MKNITKNNEKQVKFNVLTKFCCTNLGLRVKNGEYHACLVQTKENENGKAKITAAYDLIEEKEVGRDELHEISKINDMFVLREETHPFTCWVEPNLKNKIMSEMMCRNAKLRLARLSSYVYHTEYEYRDEGYFRRDYFSKDKKVSLQTIVSVLKYVNKNESFNEESKN